MDSPPPPRLPLYAQIAQGLREQIARGEPALGASLPSEEALCRRFAASRYTIRAALKLLEDAGQLRRRNGLRSIVIAQQPGAVFTQTIGALAELLNYPPDTRRVNQRAEAIGADAAEAALLDCPVGAAWFRISAIRRAPTHAQPLAWVEIYLLPDYAAVVHRRDHEQSHVYEQVERQFGEVITRARVEMLPDRVPAAVAPHLGVAADSPALTVIRRYLGREGRMFELTRSIHPEGRYVFSMEFARGRVR